ncbi:ribonuclease H protein, partial [Trifolium medium]|nr:ribonuclease H protein [Trifolium medium]
PIKGNTDGTALGSPGHAACGGILRNHLGQNLGCFAANIGVANALYAELMGVILAIEIAYEKNWNYLWFGV